MTDLAPPLPQAAGLVVNGTVGDDTFLEGDSDNDTINGLDGNDNLFGWAGNDSLLGGDGNDYLSGGDGDDYLNPGDNAIGGWDHVNTGRGNDTVDLSDMTSGSAWLTLSLTSHNGTPETQGVIATIDGSTNYGYIDKGAGHGSTTILSLNNALIPGALDGGIGLNGTAFSDTFNINAGDSGWISVKGGDGQDTYNLTVSDGTIRLEFNSATNAIDVDLGTGIIADDGYGNREVINTVEAVSEIRGSDHADSITGSGRDERFILQQGADTLDGGGGSDTVRYDRSGVEAVSVDLKAGTATGIWSTKAFSHDLSRIENVIGSRFSDDQISGTGGRNVLQGRGGADTLNGLSGNDSLIGGDGADLLKGGRGKDVLKGDGPVNYFAAEGIPLKNKGNDTLYGGEGNDVLFGGSGADLLKGGEGRDRLKGGEGKDQLIGGAGNDRLEGGSGNDTFVFSTGNDTIVDFNTFNNREDIDLSKVDSISGFRDLTNNHVTEEKGNLIISDDSGNTLTLKGVELADLDRGDFIF